MDEFHEEDLPNEGLKDVANLCGMEVVKLLLENLPGQTLPIPQTGFAMLKEKAAKDGRENGPYKIDDLQNSNWKLVAEKCGMPVIISLFEHAGNIVVTIPKNPLRKLFHRYAVKHYDSARKNSMEVALALGISRTHFFDILNEPSPHFKRGQNDPLNSMQMRLV